MSSSEFRGTNRFIIQRRIGTGGFGVVYAVRDVQNDHLVALKTLKNLTAESLYRFKREFRSLADINHSNLVQLYELFSEGDEWFFTMELVHGRSFLQHLWSSPSDAESPDSSLSIDRTETDLSPELTQQAEAARMVQVHETQSVSQSTPADLQRVKSFFHQLVDGVAALHQAGNIHRDLKPSNVLVTPEERVVVLDFGLVIDLDAEATLQSLQIAGTPAYMSPEQGAGLPLSSATDWYSVGVMLFEALTCRVPFRGSNHLEILAAKQQREPPPPSRLVTGIPEYLDMLCRDLLRRDVAKRPGADEIRERLEDSEWRAAAPRPAPVRPEPRSYFVGREKQFSQLKKAMDEAADKTVTVCLNGLSGMGKSSLAKRFLDRWHDENPDTVILTGRCYEREFVPYKAVDSFIDSLARYLRRLPELEAESLLPRDMLALNQLFPVLRRLEAPLLARRRQAVVPDSQELRRRAFAALREMMERVADRRPTIVFIDDLQWGDTDSADLLHETFSSPDSAPVLFIAAYRSDEIRTSPFLRAFLTAENARLLNMRELRVEHLTAEESRNLASALLDQKTPRLTEIAATIAAEAGGSPFFIDELVRSAAAEPNDVRQPQTLDSDARDTTLVEMIQLRVARLPREARELLELIAVNGQPLPVQVLKLAASSESQESSLALLRTEHFVRTRETETQNELESYHDRIREAVVQSLSADMLRKHHGALASAFERTPGSDAQVMAEHFFAAGEPQRAIDYTIAAADNAGKVLAFDRAAELYRRVIDLLPDDPKRVATIKKRLGEALVNAGRGPEAAKVFLSIKAGFVERLNFRHRAAQQYLFSGHIDEGLSVLRVVVQSIGLSLPETWFRTLLLFFMSRIRVRLRGLRFRERPQESIRPDKLVRIDTCLAVGVGLSNVDTLRGAIFQGLNFVWALSAGEIHRVALAFSLEAVHSSSGGTRTVKRTHRVLDCARESTERADTSYARAFLALCSGVIAQHEGRWRDAVIDGARAEKLFRDHCKAVAWGIDSSWFFNLHSSYYLGDLRSIFERYPDLLKDANDRGDLYAATSLRVMLAHYVSLASDEPERALRDVQDAMSRWSQAGFHIQHLWEFWSSIDIALYEGAGMLAWTRVNNTWPALRTAAVLHIQYTRVNLFDLRGRSALAAAESLEFPAQRTGFLKEAERAAGRLDRERAGWASAFASFIRIGVEVRRGKIEEAVRDLVALERTLASLEMSLHLAVAQRRRGELIGGAEGEALRKLSDGSMRGQNITNPDRFSYVIAPWRASDPQG